MVLQILLCQVYGEQLRLVGFKTGTGNFTNNVNECSHIRSVEEVFLWSKNCFHILPISVIEKGTGFYMNSGFSSLELKAHGEVIG